MKNFRVHLFVIVSSMCGGHLAAQSHDLYVCATLDVNFIVGSNTNPTNGVFRLQDDGTWAHIGINDPYSTAITFDPRDSNIFYTATLNGVLRTLDGGTRWREMTSWDMAQPQDVEVDPNEPDSLYLALREGMAASFDGGMSWAFTGNGLPVQGRYAQVVAVDRTQAGRVLAGCEIGIYLSEDRAASWTRVLATVETVNDVQQSPHDPDLWLAVTQSAGAWRSSDGGESWAQVAGVPSSATLYNVTFDPTNAQRMAIGSWTHGIHTSEDGGQTWQTRNVGLPTGHHVWRVAIHPDSGRLYAGVVESDLFQSDDFGRTWTGANLTGSQISEFKFVPRN